FKAAVLATGRLRRRLLSSSLRSVVSPAVSLS
ncbi:MAG: hypothetical protein ACI9U2_002345, partial [Bradymonadia bacterium]